MSFFRYSAKAFCALIVIVSGYSCTNKIKYENGAVPPEQAAATYEVAEGFQIELIASEPEVMDPVDMEIDENGTMYAVEMPGYPLDKEHTGRIRILKDTDGDGKMDKSILFAEELRFPNGIMRWKKGVIVTDVPNVLYLEDSDGDGRADIRDTLLTGFAVSNPHLLVNNPVYGLDNWVYLAHAGLAGSRKYEDIFGDLGDSISFYKQAGLPKLAKNAGSKNVRFRPDQGKLEMLSAKSQFGHAFNEWHDHILTFNSHHIYHEVIKAAYLDRNPALQLSNATEAISDHGKETEVFAITTNPDPQLSFSPIGFTTSSGGITYYGGGKFPPPYDQGAVFVTESVSNLVHVDKLVPKGATFKAQRVEARKEFLASTDFWARPVNMYVGPDGALYVLDYYRRIIEHPEFMAYEDIDKGNLYDGNNMGRIFRITPVGTPKADWTKGLSLGSVSNQELVKYLSDENQWWRTHAQRLLVERKDQAVVPALEQMAMGGKNAFGRLHALWTLEGMESLQEQVLMATLGDSEPGVRENALRISERFLTGSKAILQKVIAAKDDASAKVRFQALCTLGWVDDPKAVAAGHEILFRDLKDEWVQIAALTSGHVKSLQLLQLLSQKYRATGDDHYLPLIQRVSEMAGSSEPDPDRVGALLGSAIAGRESGRNALNESVLSGLSRGIKRNQNKKEILKAHSGALLTTFFDHKSAAIREQALNLLAETDSTDKGMILQNVDVALKKASDPSLPEGYRAQMLSYLLLSDVNSYLPVLKRMVVSESNGVVQRAAVRVLASSRQLEVARFLVDNWAEISHEGREAALDIFFKGKEHGTILLDALEAGVVDKASLGWPKTLSLLRGFDDRDFQSRAIRILKVSKDIDDISELYEAVSKHEGKPSAGFEIFKNNCSVCHQIRGEAGISYGPDLGTVHAWSARDLLANILNPNLSLAQGFDVWEVRLQNGDIMQGMIKAETANTIELMLGPQVTQLINRQDIKYIGSLHTSFMPGFSGVLDEKELADLIAFLRNSTLNETEK